MYIKNTVGLNLGPTYYENTTQKIDAQENYENIEWRAKLKVKCKQIKYYGFINFYQESQKSLIMSIGYSPVIIIAVDVNDNEILLFDGYIHGYDAICLNYGYTEEHIKNREPTELLFTENNQEFEVILSALYTTNYDDWIKSGSDHLDEKDRLEIIPNLFMDFIEFKR
jgi:hypothetical protein